MVGGSRIRQIGWALVLGVCFALLLALTFKVNAVKSDVRLAERQIIAAQQAKLMLETEFETRASQQQLAALNRMEFGYVAPGPGQFLPNERALAAFAEPRAAGAPQMIRVARGDIADVELASFSGEVAEAVADDEPEAKPREEKPTAQPSFQRAVVEKAEDAAKEKAQPSFAALFADYRLDKEASE